jgi:peptide/nickel transport system ATP-binding protein
LNLLKELQARFGLTILFISHNLAVVRQMADDTAVLRYGKIEEVNTTEAVYQCPQAEYTKSLLAQTPIMPKFWRQ